MHFGILGCVIIGNKGGTKERSPPFHKKYKEYLYFSAPFQEGADYILSVIITNNTNHRLVDELHTKYFILGTWLRIAH